MEMTRQSSTGNPMRLRAPQAASSLSSSNAQGPSKTPQNSEGTQPPGNGNSANPHVQAQVALAMKSIAGVQGISGRRRGNFMGAVAATGNDNNTKYGVKTQLYVIYQLFVLPTPRLSFLTPFFSKVLQ